MNLGQISKKLNASINILIFSIVLIMLHEIIFLTGKIYCIFENLMMKHIYFDSLYKNIIDQTRTFKQIKHVMKLWLRFDAKWLGYQSTSEHY